LDYDAEMGKTIAKRKVLDAETAEVVLDEIKSN